MGEHVSTIPISRLGRAAVFWYGGEKWLDGGGDFNPAVIVGDRIVSSHRVYVVAERWIGLDGWHIVLRDPDTPGEKTPPWERKDV